MGLTEEIENIRAENEYLSNNYQILLQRYEELQTRVSKNSGEEMHGQLNNMNDSCELEIQQRESSEHHF